MLVLQRLGRVPLNGWLRQWPASGEEGDADGADGLARVRVADSQMLPWLRPGDDVLVATGLVARQGDMVVAAVNGRLVTRFVQERPRGWYLTAARGSGRSIRVDDGVTIVGIVVEVAYRP